MPAFVFLATLDLFSHWFHMHSTLVAGSKSHKQVSKDTNILLRLYYTSRPMLFTVCACQELVYMMLFVVRIPDAPRIASIAWIILYCCMPLFVFKQVRHVWHIAADVHSVYPLHQTRATSANFAPISTIFPAAASGRAFKTLKTFLVFRVSEFSNFRVWNARTARSRKILNPSIQNAKMRNIFSKEFFS